MGARDRERKGSGERGFGIFTVDTPKGFMKGSKAAVEGAAREHRVASREHEQHRGSI